MKKYIAPTLISFVSILSFSLVYCQSKLTKTRNGVASQSQQLIDTVFFRNYICERTAYLYLKPSLNSRTKTRIPKNVGITTINESGEFEYGSFNVSSNKSFKGWFLKTDLKRLLFTPPKTDK
jgi:hypothetical protein